MTQTDCVRRGPQEGAPDLVDYRVVHRAMVVDLYRLAGAVAQLLDRPDPVRMAALRHYLDAVSAEIESHHHVEEEYVRPFLVTVAGARAGLVAPTEHRLDQLLYRAAGLAALDRATPQLLAVLREIADLLVRRIAEEEREMFPIIEEYVRVEDYERLQRRFQGGMRLRRLRFFLPWLFRHTTVDERRVLLRSARWPVRVLLMILEPGFRAWEEVLFG